MRKIEMIEESFPAEENEIRVLEVRLGVGLPEQYKKWLEVQDGGIPRHINCNIDKLPNLNVGIHIAEFLSLKRIFEIYRIYESRIPRDLIPVARDGEGNLICICALGEQMGVIYFWDHEGEPAAFELLEKMPPLDSSNLLPIASTFNEFLDLLGP